MNINFYFQPIGNREVNYVHVLKSHVKTVKAAENRPELSNFIFNTPYSRWIDVKETALH